MADPSAGPTTNRATPAPFNEIAYMHENPVRAGFAEKPTDWPWSSARNYEGLPAEIPVVLYPE